MTDTVIEVEGLGKKFCRSLKRSLYYGTVDAARSFAGLSSRSGTLRPGEFWALDDVSLSVQRGHALGLIGANGCGKTTLLRLISGIFPPDRGRVMIRGRVASLIAVGAGFHPHMSGRENVFLNGVLLGLTKAEISRRFDEIVEFAELGPFIDAPVSTYSSGMRVRLGFAVAIHTDPDVLLVDEVMSVGDTRFRRKASDAMSRLLTESDATLVLVSHNAFTVREQCDSALLLSHGKPVFYGSVEEAYDEYHRIEASPAARETYSDFLFFNIHSAAGQDIMTAGEKFEIRFGLRSELFSDTPLPITITMFDRENTPLACYRTATGKFKPNAENRLEAEALPLAGGTYFFQCKVGSDFHGTSVIRNHQVRVVGESVPVSHAICAPMWEVALHSTS